MKTIKFKISLEDFKTRRINTIPSIYNNIKLGDTDDVFVFNGRNLISGATDNELMINYGMYPSDITIPSSAFASSDEDLVISYPCLRRRYSFMVSYNDMLFSNDGCISHKYDSIRERNLFEKTNLDESLDDRYALYGGDGVYKWLCENVFVRFIFSEKLGDGTWKNYKDEWGKDYLELGEFLYWFKWFGDRYCEYHEGEPLDDTCCDYAKYMALGGNDIYPEMKVFFNGLKSCEYTNKTLSCVFRNSECFVEDGKFYNWYLDEKELSASTEQNFSSFIELPIYLDTTIDDMGEMSIFSSEWENYTDYENGSVVTYNDRDWVKVTPPEGHGYLYSESYHEGYFASSEGRTELEAKYYADSESHMKSGYETDDQWKRNIDAYFVSHGSEFNSNVTYFSYKDDVLITSTATTESAALEELLPKMANTYDVTNSTNGCILYNGTLIEAVKRYYVIYSRNTSFFDKSRHYTTKDESSAFNNHILFVYFEDEVHKLNPYVVLGGKKLYGMYGIKDSGDFAHVTKDKERYFSKQYAKGVELDWYFDFSRIPNVGNGEECKKMEDKDKFIIINNDVYLVGNDNKVKIDGVDYKLFDNYVEINGVVYPIYDESIKAYKFNIENAEYDYNDDDNFPLGFNLKDDTIDNKSYGYTCEGNVISAYTPFMLYKFDYVSGETDSKLALFRDDAVAYDDMGNELYGIFAESDEGIERPKEGDVLEPPIHVGNTKFLDELVPIDFHTSTSTTAEYWGDILAQMKFYIKDCNGNELITITMDTNTATTILYIDEYYEEEYQISPLTADTVNEIITKLEEKLDKIREKEMSGDKLEGSDITKIDNFMKEHNGLDNNIYCEFTYYMGAKITRDIEIRDGKYKYGNFNVDDMLEIKDKEDNVIGKKINGVRYRETTVVTRKECKYSLNDRVSYMIKYIDFEPTTKTIELNDYGGKKVNVRTATFETNISKFYPSDIGYFARDNGFILLPTLREEYRFGISTIENVKSDIYIDRGIAQSVDKHLRLMEIDTYEDLANYGNGYFNIKDS